MNVNKPFLNLLIIMYYDHTDVIFIKKAVKDGHLSAPEGTIWLNKWEGKTAEQVRKIDSVFLPKAFKHVADTGLYVRAAYKSGGWTMAKESWLEARKYYNGHKNIAVPYAKKEAMSKLAKGRAAKPKPRTAGAVKLDSFINKPAKKKTVKKKPAAKKTALKRPG